MATIPHRVIRKIQKELSRPWNTYRTRKAKLFINPTHDELIAIEKCMRDVGIKVEDYTPDVKNYHEFCREMQFPADYHGGIKGGVYNEKLLEHFIAYDLLRLRSYGNEDVYIDVAAGSSPWALLLRKTINVEAYAIDFIIGDNFKILPFYQCQDATRTSFAASSVRGSSLQCAFEMFVGEHDVEFIKELARILKYGGRCIISPLYMHTQYCGYSTQEYYGKGHADMGAIEYIRRDCWGVPFSRKYDAIHLKSRVLDEIKRQGMKYRLLALRNKKSFGDSIYCHFILEITR